MKKLNLLTLSAALLMGLASCGGNNNASSTPASDASTPASVQPSAPTSENVSVDYAALAERAYQQISATYDDWAKGITSEQTIYLTTKVDGVEFTVEYAISDEAKDYLKIEGDKLVVTADEEDHSFVNAVTVTVKFDGTAYAAHSLNVKVSALAIVKLSAIWGMKKDDAVTSRGKITAMYGKNFFMQDGEVGTEVYTSADWGVKVGDYVEVAGVISVYNGLYEIVPNKEGGVVILDGAGGVEEPVNIELGPDTDISEAKAVGGRIFSATNLYVKEISLEQSSSSGYYVKGTVLADGKDGTKKLTLRIEERYAGREMMESWGVSYDAAGVPTLGDTISAGDILEVNGILNWYNAPQISLATVTKVTEGEAPADPIEINATFAEVITAGKALASGESSYDYYVFTAYVVKNSGTNYFLGETANADTSDEKALFEIYKASEANQAKLLKGAKVTVKTKIKNYNAQVEDAGDATLTITVVEAGEPWVVNYTQVDVAGAIAAALALANGATSTELYKVSGYIIAVTYAWSNGTASITLGATAEATEVLTVYKLNVPEADKDKIVVGAQLTVGGNLQNYYKSADESHDESHTPELVNGKVLEWGEIPTPQESQVISATFAEVITAGKALESNAVTTDEYEFEAYVVKKSGTNYFLGATAEADTSDDKALFEIYKASEENQAKLLKGAKVKIKTIVKNFKGQVEDAGAPEITVLEAGEEWSFPVVAATFAEVITAGKALASNAVSASMYEFEAYAVKKSGTNYFLAATADANTDDDKALFEIYKASEENQAKLLKGAKVKVKTLIKNYNAQVEDAGSDSLTITVLTEGGSWETAPEQPSGDSVTLDATVSGAISTFPSAYAAAAPETGWDVAFGTETIAISGANIKANSGYIMMGSKAQKATAFFFNQTAFAKAIASITITTGSSAAASAKYAINFGTAALSTANVDNAVNVTNGASHTFTNSVAGAKYFQIASTDTGYNGQVAKIVITFADAA